MRILGSAALGALIGLVVGQVLVSRLDIQQHDEDIEFLLEEHLYEMKFRGEMDSLHNECLEVIDSRLDRLDSLIKL